MTTVIPHPWQNGPAELIKLAIEHLHKETEFDQRISFLLLDVGVETLFKTFLTLPEGVTGAKTKFPDRRKAAEGGFHDLVEGVKAAAPSRLSQFNLAHIQFYHDLRNRLYHQGNGITIPTEKAKGYAKLAVDMLKTLLDVDLTDLLREPEIRAQIQKKQENLEQELDQQIIRVHQELGILELALQSAIEKIEPKLLLPSFVMAFNRGPEFEDLEDDRNTMRHLREFRAKAIDAAVSDQALKDYLLSKEIRRHLPGCDNIELYLLIIGRYSPEAVDWSRHYECAKMFPRYAQEPDFVTSDKDGSIIGERKPTTSEVVEEGKRLLSDLKKTRERIWHWANESH